MVWLATVCEGNIPLARGSFVAKKLQKSVFEDLHNLGGKNVILLARHGVALAAQTCEPGLDLADYCSGGIYEQPLHPPSYDLMR